MKRFINYLLATTLLAATLGSTAIAYAAPTDQANANPPATVQAPRDGEGQRPPPPPDGDGRGPRPGPGGQVTAVSATSITVRTPREEALLVNVNNQTTVHIAETHSEGALSDVTIGDNVMIHGRPNRQGAFNARDILIEPDGDKLGGAVTAVNGLTLRVENREGTGTIVLTADSKLLTPEGTATLADISTGKHVVAFGTKQADGAVVARVVIVGEDRSPHR